MLPSARLRPVHPSLHMPKKHQQNFGKLSSNYVHPSLSSSRPSSSSNTGPSSPRTVNERLNQLRREQAPRSAIDHRNEIVEFLPQSAIHPDVRRILNLPETAPPRPNGPTRLANGRRVPGPAAPRSWLETTRHAPDEVRKQTVLRPHGRYRPFDPTFPERMPQQGSLVQQTLKAMAANWEYLLEYEQYNLCTLPVQLKGMLISYLTIYGPEGGITPQTLKTLFLNDNELEGGTGSEELTHLDLSSLISQRLTVADLTKYVTHSPTPKADDLAAGMDRLAVSSDEVADSWEDAAETETMVPSIPKAVVNVRFPSLTHLSLSHPSCASWAHLLNLSKHLSTLNHLSLAFWPTPTLTPNANTASLSNAHGQPVNLSGTHFYAALDADWAEASNILRRLANNTYCLRRLDLTGCDWISALAYGVPDRGEWVRDASNGTRWTTARPQHGDKDDDSWEIRQAVSGPDWNGPWRQLTHVSIGQGWIPRNVNAIRALPAGLMGCELLGYLRSDEGGERLKREGGSLGAGMETEAHVRRWMEREKEGRRVEGVVRRLRAAAKGKYVSFDHGWTPGLQLSLAGGDE